jgi:hypothetical protein
MNRKRSDGIAPERTQVQPGPLLPTPAGLSSPRHGVDAAEEDIATLALRSMAAMTTNDEVADEALGMLLSLEIAKRDVRRHD